MAAVTHQPQPSEWKSGVFDCFEDKSICILGLCCLPILGCKIASNMDECCLCGVSVAMRSVYRTKYNIPGSICSDFMWSIVFAPCTFCQLQRDINERKAHGIL
ncbi:placenta associated 8, tandem duplicate 2 [Latimeria chalumnae]|uniref:placenta associated 8, tandem duplicate 2 n=1 Tax=Latimeria chalumnae TaxID=7897 RepID=UPI00313ADA84